MGYSKDNSRVAKLAAEEALTQAQRAEVAANSVEDVIAESEQVTLDNKIIPLTTVDTVTLRDSTYPNPLNGSLVTVNQGANGNAETYRFVTGTGWVLVDKYNGTTVSNITAQLADKLSKGSVAVTDINKNLGKFDQTYMTTEFIQQIAGTAPVNAIVAAGGATNEKLAKTAVSPDKTDFAEVIHLSPNLFDVSKVTEGGYYYFQTGAWAVNALLGTTGYIIVKPNTAYIKKYAANVTFYDIGKNFISGVDSATFTTPANTYYIRYSVVLSSMNAEMMIEGTTLPSAYKPFSDAVTIKNLLVKEDDVIFLDKEADNYVLRSNIKTKPTAIPDAFSASSNLIDTSKITANKVPALASGVLVDNASYSSSDYIPVKAGLQYTQNLTSYKVFYDVNKVFISSSDGVNTVTAPTNSAFLRVAVKNDQIPSVTQLNEGATLLPYEKFGYKLNGSIAVSTSGNTEGLKAVVLGDSISNGVLGLGGANNYVDLLPAQLGLSSIVNYSFDGSTIANVSGVAVGVDPYPMVDRFSSMDSDANIVILFGGTNDYGRGMNYDASYTGAMSMQPTLGTENSVDKTTFNGALNLLLDGLITKYPTALIVGILPLHRYHDEYPNTRGLTLKDYVEAEKKAYQKYGIPYFDLYSNGSLFPTNATSKATYAPDGLHPNGNYHSKILTPRIANFIQLLL